ncbi:hypothetical protein HanXRQr2_Chr12g0535541 [Helianthus annuus]|uniref:Uncharacterized protein n=1 Tax=Helianthus annuus TaxID=4232 RepID=A0A251T2G9_HELAN|nr:hypothetical protein HanXRQr2_Chr12g0535541 [Helianthus annuus]KAJ0492627.1 hypothetical protein HanIR_Chr12g0576981 [Helianthus annuus]KAJ0862243.1 hypothetical protein HanPSC8_Chr12g0515841 [Helianthus annuus]
MCNKHLRVTQTLHNQHQRFLFPAKHRRFIFFFIRHSSSNHSGHSDDYEHREKTCKNSAHLKILLNVKRRQVKGEEERLQKICESRRIVV